MFDKYQKIVFCLFVVLLFIPFSGVFFGPQNEINFESTQTSAPKTHEADDSNSESTQIAGTPGIQINSATNQPHRGTRPGSTVPHSNTGSNDPNVGADQFYKDDKLIGTIKSGELHWFRTSDLRTPSPSGKVYNISISPSLSIAWNDWVIVRLYAFIDVNSNNNIDDKDATETAVNYKELFLMHQESYSGSSSTWETCWGVASYLSDYYVCVEGRPNNPQSSGISYSLTATWIAQDLSLRDQNGGWDISNAIPITSFNTGVKNKFIDMDGETFDWFVIDAPSDNDMIGVNTSITIKTTKFPPPYTDPYGNKFVLETCVMILHERARDGKLVFGGFKNASRHKGLGLRKLVVIDSNHFISGPASGSNAISRSYICVFADTYGFDPKYMEHKYNDTDFTTDTEDIPMNGWIEYNILKVSCIPIIRSELRNVEVKSLRTNTKEGKTYDAYRYKVEYHSEANYEPVIMKVHIYKSSQLLRIDNMQPVDPTNTNYRTGPEYTFIIDGSMLGEGEYWYQIECWDRHTYAKGSKAEGIIYHGPIIRNNIPPQVRPTAPSYIEMLEDDRPYYIKLSDIFIDVDGDDMIFFLLDPNGTKTVFIGEEWTGCLQAKIINNKKLRLTPLKNQYGNTILKISASDFPADPNATHKLEVTILPINDPPQIKTRFNKLYFFGEIRFDEDTNYTDLNLSKVFWDPIEWDPLTFKVTGNENVFVNIEENGSVEFTAKENWSGVEILTFSATDPPGGSVTDELKVVVEPINDAPIINQTPPIICYEESWTNITFQAWDPADDDQLIFRTNVGLALNLKDADYDFNQYTGELSLFPPNRVATGEEYTVTVWVRDVPALGKSIEVSTEIIFIVRNKWDQPVPKILEPNHGDVFLNFESITFVGICLDDDLKVPQLKEKITYEWYSDKDGLLGQQDVVRNVVLSPGEKGYKHKITLVVSDGKYRASTNISIWVTKEQRKDTDGDGMPDYWEDRNNLDKFNRNDADGDPDQDNFTNLEEYKFGRDGIEGTNDPTDPWDFNDHPPETLKEIRKEEEEDYFWLGVALLITLLVIALMVLVTSSFITRKVRDAREYSEKRYEMEARVRKEIAELEEAKYGLYGSKPVEVLCHKCGTRNKVRSKHRPLAVKCKQCNYRGVIYK